MAPAAGIRAQAFDEVGDLPEDWGMYSYANLNFACGKAFLEYEYRTGAFATDKPDDLGGYKMDWRTKSKSGSPSVSRTDVVMSA